MSYIHPHAYVNSNIPSRCQNAVLPLGIDSSIQQVNVLPCDQNKLYITRENYFTVAQNCQAVLSVKPYHLISCIKDFRGSVFNPETDSFNDLERNRKNLSLLTALESGILCHWSTAVLHNVLNKAFILPVAYKLGLINDQGQVKDVKAGTFVSLDEALSFGLLLSLQKPINICNAIRAQLFHNDSGTFEDPSSSELISFISAVSQNGGFIDGSSAVLLSEANKKPIPFMAAVAQRLIDDYGRVGFSETDIVPLDVAFEHGLLQNCQLPLSLPEALAIDCYSSTTGLFRLDQTSQKSLKSALSAGDITSINCVVIGQTTTEKFSLIEAIQNGLIDAGLGVYHGLHGVCLNLDSAFSKKLILPTRQQPSLIDMIMSECYKQEWKRMVFGTSYQLSLDLYDALKKEFIHSRNCFAWDCQLNQAFTVDRATQRGFLDLKEGLIYTDHWGESVDLKTAIEMGLLFELVPPVEFKQLIDLHLILPTDNLLLNATTGDYVAFERAVKQGVLDKTSFKLLDTRQTEPTFLSYDQAVEKQILLPSIGRVHNFQTGQSLPLILAWADGLILEAQPTISLHQAVESGLFQDNNGTVLDQFSGTYLQLHAAVKSGVIECDLPAVRSEKKSPALSLSQAFAHKTVDRSTGRLVSSNSCLTLSAALQHGLILGSCDSMPLFDVIQSGLINKESGLIQHPVIERHLTLSDAIETGFLSLPTSILMTAVGPTNLKLAIRRRLVDCSSNTIIHPKTALPVSLQVAFELGLILPGTKPLTLSDLFDNKLYNAETAKFMDPVAGDYLDLQQALQYGLIDPTRNFFCNRVTLELKRLNQAADDGLISVPRGEVLDTSTNQWCSYDEAFSTGSLMTTEPNLSFAEACERNLISVKHCTFTDMRFEVVLPLGNAIRSRLIDCTDVFAKDIKNDTYIPIHTAIRIKVVDLDKRVTVDPLSGQWYPLILRYPNGIITFSRQSFTFDYIVDKGYFNFSNGLVRDPMSEDQCHQLDAAIELNILDPTSAVIKDKAKNQLVHLDKAIENGLLLVKEATVLDSITQECHSIMSALESDLLMTSQKRVPLRVAMEFGLFDWSACRFKSPYTASGDMSFGESVTKRLLDISNTYVTEAKLTVPEAIGQHLMDGVSGSVFDTEAKQLCNLAEAYERQLIVDEAVNKYGQMLKLVASAICAVLTDPSLAETVERACSARQADIDQLLDSITQMKRTLALQSTDQSLVHTISYLKNTQFELQSVESEVKETLSITNELCTQGADIMSPDEFSSLRRRQNQLRKDFDDMQTSSETMIDRVTVASDLESVLNADCDRFKGWLTTTDRDISDVMGASGDPRQLQHCRFRAQELTDQVVSHAEDLRSLQSLSSRLEDELGGYVSELNVLRGAESPPVPQAGAKHSETRERVTQLHDEYMVLTRRCDELHNLHTAVEDLADKYHSKLAAAREWVDEMQSEASGAINRPLGAEPSELESQLGSNRDLSSRLLNGEGLLVEVRSSSSLYLMAIEGTEQHPIVKQQVEGECDELERKHSDTKRKLSDHSSQLQTLLTQSQGVHAGLDDLLKWLQETETRLARPQPLPLERNALSEQNREHQLMESEINGRRPALEDLQSSVDQLLRSSPSSSVDHLPDQVSDMNRRYEVIGRKCGSWGDNVSDAQNRLQTFHDSLHQLDSWLNPALQTLFSKDLSQQEHEAFNSVIQRYRSEAHEKEPELERIRSQLGNLLSLPNVTETEAVRERLADTEQRWANLKDQLNNREAEVQQRSAQLTDYQDALQALQDWLRDTEDFVDNLQSPSTEPKGIKNQLQEQKLLEKLIDDKQPNVNSFLTLVERVLPFAADANEKEKLQADKADMARRYSGLSQRAHDRKKQLQEAQGLAGQWQESAGQFIAWLDVTEKQLDQLANVPTDEDKLQKQIEQQAKLAAEIDEQKPEFDSLIELCPQLMALASKEDADDLNGQLNQIVVRYDNLGNKIGQQSGLLEGDLADKYHSILTAAKDWVSQMEGEASAAISQPPGAEPSELQSQLGSNRDLTGRLLDGEGVLTQVRSSGNLYLMAIEGTEQHPVIKQKVDGECEELERKHSDTKRKVSDHSNQLQTLLTQSQGVHEGLDDLLKWLHETETRLAQPQPLPLEKDALAEQGRDQQLLESEIKSHKPALEVIQTSVDQLVMSSPSSSMAHLPEQVSDMHKRYDIIGQKCGNWADNVSHAQSKLEAFHDSLHQFDSWLNPAVEVLSSGDLSKQQHDSLLSLLEKYHSEVAEKEPELQSIRMQSNDLLNLPNVAETEAVRQEMADTEQRWASLKDLLSARDAQVHQRADQLSGYQDSLKAMQDWLGDTEKLMDNQRTPSTDPRVISSQLQEQKLLERLIDDKQPAVNAFCALAFQVEPLTSETEKLQEERDDVTDRYDKLSHQAHDNKKQLEAAQELAQKWQESSGQLVPWLDWTEKRLQQLGNVPTDEDKLKEQIEEQMKLGAEIDAQRPHCDSLVDLCPQLMGLVSQEDADNLDGQLKEMVGKYGSLQDQAGQQAGLLEDMADKVKQFHADRENMNAWLDEAEQGLSQPGESASDALNNSFKPVVEKYRSEADEKEPEIENIRTQCNNLLNMPNVSETESVRQKMAETDQRWGGLKDQLKNRQAELQLQGEQFNKYQDNLKAIQGWLEDTEELMDNQPTPSTDHKVVKSQLQEQKLLEKLIDDKEPSVNDLCALVKKIEPMASDDQEKDKMNHELDHVTKRYDKLAQQAHDRKNQLQEAQELAEQWHDLSGHLVGWLDNTEKQLQQFGNVPTDEDKLQEQIEDQAKLGTEIAAQRQHFDDLDNLCPQLMGLVSKEDADVLNDELEQIIGRYNSLGTRAQQQTGLLEEVAGRIQQFYGHTDDLAAWLDAAEDRLSQFSVLSVFPEQLEEQSCGMMELAAEITEKQADVSEIIDDEGRELCKLTTGDEAVSLQLRLEGFRLRFNDLSNRAGAKVDQLLEAVPLAQSYHEGHQKIDDWLVIVEEDLARIDQLNMDEQDNLIKHMESDVGMFRMDLESVTLTGARLGQISAGEGASTIESMSSNLARRFDAVCEQVQRRAERLEMTRKRSLEVLNDMDDLTQWFRDAEERTVAAGAASADPETTRQQLLDQRMLNSDIVAQKGRVRDLIAAGKKLARDLATAGEEVHLVQEKIDTLKDRSDSASRHSHERLSVLEEALPLAQSFAEQLTEVSQWLTTVETEIESCPDVIPGLHPEQLRKQKAHNQELLDTIQSHKALVDRCEKTGLNLADLCTDDDANHIKDTLENVLGRYATLRDSVRDREMALDEAVQESAQFSDKLDMFLENLTSAADQVRNPEPVAAQPDKIRGQIEDNCALMEQLEHKSVAFQAVKDEADRQIAKAKADDPAIEEIRAKINKLDDLWNEIQGGTEDRGRTLADTLAASEQFWDELEKCIDAVQELKARLDSSEPPACEPEAIQSQQDDLKAIEIELHETAPRIDLCKEAGQRLLELVGSPEKPEVERGLSALDDSWNAVTGLYHNRHHNLIEAMERSMSFHDLLRNILEWLDSAESRVASWSPLSSITLEQIHGELQLLDAFRQETDTKAVDKERLVQACNDLIDHSTPAQAADLRRPLNDLKIRWDALNATINDRQQKLERALLEMGQFQQAYDQLMEWMVKSEQTLDDIKPALGDLQATEIALAKHKVLENDISAHQTSIDTLNTAGQRMMASGTEAPEQTQQQLDTMNDLWKQLLENLAKKLAELEAAKDETEGFGGQIEGWTLWLDDMDAAVGSSKPTGGLPDTARQQLDEFGLLEAEMEEHRPKLEAALQAGDDYMEGAADENANSALAQRLRSMKQKWGNVQTKAVDRKKKLEIALRDAEEFHLMISDMNEWLSRAEQTLNSLEHVSRLPEPIANQMEDNTIFQGEVQTQREVANDLHARGTKLQYYCEKKDAIPIKNLLVSAKHRFDKVVSRTADRTRQLDVGYNETKEFHTAWQELCNWLDESKEWLDTQTDQTATNPDRIKEQLTRHKDFQGELGIRQPHYDQTAKLGKALKDHAPKGEQPVIQEMLDALRNKWTALCNGAIDRQRNLEEGLLLSGQFNEAVAALLEWLAKVEPTLAADLPVHGDLETVSGLVDQHKNFQTELNGRATNVETVRKAAKELLESGDEESKAEISQQMDLLDAKWDNVGTLAELRQERLADSRKEAEEFHKGFHTILEYLAEMQTKLKLAGALPDSQDELGAQLDKLDEMKNDLDNNKSKLDDTLALGQGILAKSHPTAEGPMKRFLTILQSRWDEVSAWAKQRDDRLKGQMQSLKDQDNLIDDLLAWIGTKEKTLNEADEKPTPEDLDVVQKLIEEHQDFEADLRGRQGDVDEASKGRKAPEPSTTTKDGKQSKKPQRKSRHPKAQQLSDRWRQLWLQSMDRQRKLNDLLAYLKELKRLEAFSWEDWRNRYMDWHSNNKSRVMDFFRRMDRTGDGKIGRAPFIDGILSSKFPTTRLEMNKVADLFDKGDGMIDYREFIAALRPDRPQRTREPKSEEEKIQDEVSRQQNMCTCVSRFPIKQVGEGKYRFGANQKMRLVRILRSTVMVRVGGGWEALDEFLVKNDPCRAKGRTNIELREKFILADGVKQSMQSFTSSSKRPSISVTNGNGHAASTSSGSLGSPRYQSTPGPVMKVREKTERSVPMSRSSGRTGSSAASSYLSPDSEVSSINSTSRRHSDMSTEPRKPKSVSASGSRPSSRGGLASPLPLSRTGSDLSDASGTPTRIPSLRNRKGVPYKAPWK